MTREFPPFTRGMGPAAQYWETRPRNKPPVGVVRDFIQLLQEAKIGYLRLLADDDLRTEQAIDELQGLSSLHEHIRLHPAREQEFRRVIRDLLFHADRFGLSASERGSFIKDKIHLDPGPGHGGLEYLVHESEIERISRELMADESSITGKDFNDACSRLFSEIKLDQIISLETRGGGHQEEAVVSGESEDEAYREAQAKLPEGSVLISRSTVREVQEGVLELKADSEGEIRQIISERISGDALITESICLKPSRKGFIGIGRRIGRWKISWVKPFLVSMKYFAPFEIIVRFVRSK